MKKIIGIGVGSLVIGVLIGMLIFRISGVDKAPAYLGAGVSPSSFRDFTTNTTVTVNTSTAVLSNNNGRIYAAMINNSTNTIYLNLGTASTTADDYTIRLNANGGSYEINLENMYTGAIYASSSAASSLLVFEK